MDILIEGSMLQSESDFHHGLAVVLGVEDYYGYNLDALWDLLSANIERPILLRWICSNESKEYLGDKFEEIINVLERVKKQDERFGLSERFDYCLE